MVQAIEPLKWFKVTYRLYGIHSYQTSAISANALRESLISVLTAKLTAYEVRTGKVIITITREEAEAMIISIEEIEE